MAIWNTAERKTMIGLSPPPIPRLHLEPAPPLPALLDGGWWWPRSTDPVAELPGLIQEIDERRCLVVHVMLAAVGWDSRPRRLAVEGVDRGAVRAGRMVGIGWSDSMPAGLLTATLANGRRVDLLIVASSAGEAAAQTAMGLAATG